MRMMAIGQESSKYSMPTINNTTEEQTDLINMVD
jgi:hypothetical protein